MRCRYPVSFGLIFQFCTPRRIRISIWHLRRMLHFHLCYRGILGDSGYRTLFSWFTVKRFTNKLEPPYKASPIVWPLSLRYWVCKNKSLTKTYVLWASSYLVLESNQCPLHVKQIRFHYANEAIKSVKGTLYLRPRIPIKLNFTKKNICNCSVYQVATLSGTFYCIHYFTTTIWDSNP